MNKTRHLIVATFAVLCTAGVFWAGANGLTLSSAQPIPTCQPVKVSVGSNVYKDQACNGGNAAVWIKTPPVGKEWDITVDGGMSNGSILVAAAVNSVTKGTTAFPWLPYFANWLATKGSPRHFKWAYYLLAGTYTTAQYHYWFNWATSHGMPMPSAVAPKMVTP